MDEKMLEAQFVQLVLGLQNTAWMLLGKIANPLSGKIEPNFNAAKSAIDTLVMLREKTNGNLSKHEAMMLNNAISQLEINYVSEVEKQEKEISESAAASNETQKTKEKAKK